MTRDEHTKWAANYAPAAAALRKVNLNLNPGWLPFAFSVMHGGMVVKGAPLREVTRGPNKGQLTERDCFIDEVVVSSAEIERERRRIEKSKS